MKDFSTFIIDKQIISNEELHQVAAAGGQSSEPLYYRLLREFPEKESQIWHSLAEFLHVNLIEANQVTLDPGLAKIVPARLAHEYSIVPLSLEGQNLEIALADPRQFEQCEELALLFSRQRMRGSKEATQYRGHLTVTAQLARPGDINSMIKALYGIGAETVEDMLDEQDGSDVKIIGPEVVDLTRDEFSDDDEAIVRFVNQLLLEAVKNEASDIHLEPYEKELRVRYRVDGMLRTEPVPERIKHLEAAIISRIKIMANMDIAEKRMPQDGQIRLMVLNRPIDVRVSVLPTMFGQGLALRLLDRQVVLRNLNNLGMPDDYQSLYRHILTLSHGVVLVTGPTGSGKTTTLYASINEINRQDTKIITVEDPIEYQLTGITQIQVKPQIDLTFANLLRSILRHDPDVVMIGEIRDRATAQIAISAAMTGHLVFSTLHTNDATSAPVRLMEMGVEPYLVSSALEAVVAQRLIRVLCKHCRQATNLQELLPWKNPGELMNEGVAAFKSQGCPACQYTGYRGRTAIFEMFTLNDEIRKLILNRSDADQVRQAASRIGMRSLYESGMVKVREGISSLAEVYRIAREEVIDMQLEMGYKTD